MGGSVRRRGSRWEYRFDAGRDPVTGRRSRPGGSGFPSPEAAEQALRRAQKAHSASTLRAVTDARASLTVLAYLTAWLTEVEPGLRPSTFRAYGIYIASHVGPAIGNLRLRDLTANHLNAFYGRLLQDGHARADGGLSAKSVINIHRMLHRALSSAVRSGVIDRDMLGQAQPPTMPDRPPALPKSRVTRTAAEAGSPTGTDREAATIVASLILRNTDGRGNGREGGRDSAHVRS